MNKRIQSFMSEMQRLADLETQMYGLKKRYQQMWDEEFKTTQDNAMDDVGNVTAAEWEEAGFEYGDVNSFVTNCIDHYLTFFEGGDTLIDRERGKFARRIMAGNRHLI